MKINIALIIAFKGGGGKDFAKRLCDKRMVRVIIKQELVVNIKKYKNGETEALNEKLNNVYLLVHTYEYNENGDYEENGEYEETKILGIYSSHKTAELAVERYYVLEGFEKYPKKCFEISEYKIDEDSNFVDGFTSWYEIYEYYKKNNICEGDEYKRSIYEKSENE